MVGAAFALKQSMRPQVTDRASVVLTERGFQPNEIRVRRGSMVTFSSTEDNKYWPASDSHPAHGIYPEFDPERPLEPGESWNFTFEKEGSWGFHDHLRSYFIGTVHVVP